MFAKDPNGGCGRVSTCKTCRKKYHKKNIARARTYKDTARRKRSSLIRDAKAVPCKDCGKKYPPWVMDLDHRNPKTKISNLSQMVSKHTSLKLIFKEIRKCDAVCANCHRERSHISDIKRSLRTRKERK